MRTYIYATSSNGNYNNIIGSLTSTVYFIFTSIWKHEWILCNTTWQAAARLCSNTQEDGVTGAEQTRHDKARGR